MSATGGASQTGPDNPDTPGGQDHADRQDKAEIYRAMLVQLRGLLDGCPTPVAAMASTAALLRDTFSEMFWVGFYLPADDGSLTAGPYQGPLACLLLPAGRGVCGKVYKSGRTEIVPDVHAFPDHIACDSRSRSEIVVPVCRGGKSIAVLDCDSERINAFDEIDRKHLEAVARLVEPTL